MRKNRARLFSLFLAAAMLLSLFPASAFAEETGILIAYYDDGGGSVFWCAGADAPEAEQENYLFHDVVTDVPMGSRLCLLFDETKAIDWDTWDGESGFAFRDSWESEDRAISVRLTWDTGEEFRSSFVVVMGEAVETGFVYDDEAKTLRFTMPADWVDIQICWTREEYAFQSFGGTDEKPILVEASWWGSGSVQTDAAEGEDVFRTQNRMRLRLPLDAEEATFTWDGADILRTIRATDREGGWVEQPLPEGCSFTLPLDQYWDNNEKKTFYNVEFEFEDDWRQALCVVEYDVNGGAVFGAVGEDEPEAAADCWLNGEDQNAGVCFRDAETGGLLPVQLLLDETKALDWEAWNEGEIAFTDPWYSEDRSISITASFETADGNWYDGPVVEYGEAVCEGFRFEDNLLSFTPATISNVRFWVFWTREDYLINSFWGTEEKPLIVEVRWWNGDLILPEGIPEEDMLALPGRARLRLPLDAESVTFTWDGDSTVREVWIADLGENGEGLSVYWPDGSYTLELNQTWDDGSPKDWYALNFDFAMGCNYNFFVNYDMNGGLVFQSVGDDLPEADPACLLPNEGDGNDEWPSCVSFRTEDGIAPIRLLIDETKALDWEAWYGGEAVFTEPWYSDERAVTVIANYQTDTCEWLDVPILELGEVPEEYEDLASWENGILTFNPINGYDVRFTVMWTRSEYAFWQFHSTEEKPIIVEAGWWGDGEIRVAEDLPEEDVLAAGNRIRMRVAEDVESVTFTWSGESIVREIRVDGLGENGDTASIFWPDGNSYTLELNQTWEDGSPKNWYNIDFDFVRDVSYQFSAFYDMNGGLVFQSVGEDLPEANAAYLLPNEGDSTEERPAWISFRTEDGIQPIHLLFDETKAVDWGAWWENGEVVFIEPWYSDERAVTVIVRYQNNEGWWIDQPLLICGEFAEEAADLASWENGVLTFNPINGCDVQFTVMWTRSDYAFWQFTPTEEKPVMVEVNWGGDGEILLPDGIPEEDLLVIGNRARMRVGEDVESLTFSWDPESTVREIRVEGLSENGEHDSIPWPEGNSYTLELNQTWDDGSPRDWYNIRFEFANDCRYLFDADYDMNGGLVFQSVGGDLPEASSAYFLPRGGDGREGFPDCFSFRTGDGIAPIHLLFDETKALDWEAWDNGELAFTEPWESDERALTVIAKFQDDEGWWIDLPILVFGEVPEEAAGQASWENGVLTFTPVNGFDVRFTVMWTVSEYVFWQFHTTEEKPIMVEADWGGSGEILLPDGIPEEDLLVIGNRARMRVGRDVGSLTFSWDPESTVREIWVDGLSEDGEEDLIRWPEGNSYTLELNQTWDDGSPRDWYNLHFEFAEDCRYQFCANYDMNGGLVFWSVGDAAPAAESAFLLPAEGDAREGWSDWQSFRGEDGILPIHLLIDETKALDRDAWDNGEVSFVRPWESDERAVSVVVKYRDDEGWWIDLPILVRGEVPEEAAELASYENGVLTFTPVNGFDLRFFVMWTSSDYDFWYFYTTEEKPVMIEVRWHGDGEIALPEGIPEEDLLVIGNRARIRVGWETESLTFTWPERYRMQSIWLNGEEVTGDAGEGSYTLMLDQTWENGAPVDWYNLDFDFGWDQDGAIAVNWRGSEGNVFFAVNEIPERGNFDQYIDHPMSFLYENEAGQLVPGTVNLLLDPEHSVAYFGEGCDEWDLPPYDYCPSIYAEFIDENGEYYEGMVVVRGAAVKEGVSFENNVLSFTPGGADRIGIHVFWSDMDQAFWDFRGTEEKPVEIEIMWGMSRAVMVPEGIGEEDVIIWSAAEHTYMKLRVPEDREDLSFAWDREGRVALIEIYNGRDDEWQEIYSPEGLAYVLELTQTNEAGERAWFFEVHVWANSLIFRELVAAWEEAEAVDRSRYTVQSLNALDAVVAKVVALDEEGIPDDFTQDDVDALTEELRAALEALVPIPVFTDVKPGAYYEEAVKWAVAYGVTNGTSDTTFSPNNTCTRAQVVTFLWRAMGSPEPATTTCPFTDVKTTGYYYKAVLWAVENEITSGVSATKFGTNDPCTRAQVVTFLWRTDGRPEPVSSTCPFTDLKVGASYYKAVLWAVENGITTGTTATTFTPGKTCTRGQIVTFLYRYVVG